MQPETKTSAEVDQAWTKLRGLRDEIRVRLHLATLDLKDEWQKLEPKIAEAEQYMSTVTEASASALHELERRASALQEKLAALREQHAVRKS